MEYIKGVCSRGFFQSLNRWAYTLHNLKLTYFVFCASMISVEGCFLGCYVKFVMSRAVYQRKACFGECL
jgi:hypothetical protein